MTAKKQVQELKIVDYKEINSEFFIIELKSSIILPEILPGQFAEVLVNNSPNTFLRRPLSIHDVDYKKNTIKFLIQIVGDGTRELAKSKVNETLNVIFPLGNSFSIPKTSNVLLVGGGCGIAPLLLLAKMASLKGIKPKILIGGRNKEYLLDIEEYHKYGDVYITTEDGSVGEKGFVIHHSILWDEKMKFEKIYTCGPEPMMQAIAKYAKKRNMECEVSLENLMACGFGVCLCCVVDTIRGNVCTCTEGPVFNINELKWQI